MRVFIIEDERIKLITLSDALKKRGFEVYAFDDPIKAIDEFERIGADVVVSDIRMPGMNGIEVLKRVKEKNPDTAVIMITAYPTVESAVEVMKTGAYDYITKPFRSEDLIVLLDKIAKIKKLEAENRELKTKLYEKYRLHNIIGASSKMQEIFNKIEMVSKTDLTVLIEGESGTGKELVAQAIHYNSPRRDKPFVKVSCVALPETLLESELFGHVKGAFTGALKDRKGRFEIANGGTIFLDDIDDIPLSIQAKLLRVMQFKEFERVGSSEIIKVDIRFICATKTNLWQKVIEGKFREDLYYRLNVVPIKLPPLRERKEDIPFLLEHFIKQMGKNIKFSQEAISKLMAYDWPGNVRQLENAICRIVSFIDKDTVTAEDIPNDIFQPIENKKIIDSDFTNLESLDLNKLIEEVEIKAIKWALQKSGGNKAKASKLLGLKRTTFIEKLRKYKLN